MLLQDIFINRKEELRTIPNGIKLGQNFVLVAPRRYGKTTLIKKIIEQLPDNIIPVYIDIMRYSYSLVALTEAIVDGCLAHIGFSGKFRNWVGNINLKLDIKIKIQELELATIIEKINKNDEFSAFADALELADKLAFKSAKQWVMIYDEIGELQNLDIQAIRTMRSVIQHHKQVSYIFAGSQESVMNDIFVSSKGAFYRFGLIYHLKELDIVDVMEFFKNNLTNVSQAVIDYIVETFTGHPYYTTNLFFRIALLCEEYPNKKVGLGELKIILQELMFSESHYLEGQIGRLSKGKNILPVLKATIEGNPYNDKIQKQTVYSVLKNLVRDGYIRKHNNIYQLTDPLLQLYIAGDTLF